jgi:hypothetical protein
MSNIKVPFQKYNEEEIQTIIENIFHEKGYKIQNLHKSDRANEKGADLIAEKDQEKIIFAVKIKPQTKDKPQLLEFSDRSESKKIYVSIKTPSDSFKMFADKFKDKVIFWDEDKLNEELVNTNLYFASNLIFENHVANELLQTIQFFFFQLRKKLDKEDKKEIHEMDKESFKLLWRLKDIAVTLNKIPEFIRPFFDDPIKIENKDLNKHFLNIFLNFLDQIERIIRNYLTYFSRFYEKNQELVEASIIEMRERSHWSTLAGFEPKIDFELLRKDLEKLNTEDEDKIIKKYKKTKEDLEFENYLEDLKKNNSVWAAIENYIKNFHLFGYFIEEMTDDIISEYFKDYNSPNPNRREPRDPDY